MSRLTNFVNTDPALDGMDENQRRQIEQTLQDPAKLRNYIDTHPEMQEWEVERREQVFNTLSSDIMPSVDTVPWGEVVTSAVENIPGTFESIPPAARYIYNDITGDDTGKANALKELQAIQEYQRSVTPPALQEGSFTPKSIVHGTISQLPLQIANLATLPLAGPVLGAAAEAVPLAIMGAESAMQAYPEYREAGYGVPAAALGAGSIGAVEILTEKIGLDALLKGKGGKFIRRMVEIAIANAGEESAAQMLQETQNNIALKGMDPVTAVKTAAKGVLHVAGVGALTGVVMGGPIHPYQKAQAKTAIETMDAQLNDDKAAIAEVTDPELRARSEKAHAEKVAERNKLAEEWGSPIYEEPSAVPVVPVTDAEVNQGLGLKKIPVPKEAKAQIPTPSAFEKIDKTTGEPPLNISPQEARRRATAAEFAEANRLIAQGLTAILSIDNATEQGVLADRMTQVYPSEQLIVGIDEFEKAGGNTANFAIGTMKEKLLGNQQAEPVTTDWLQLAERVKREQATKVTAEEAVISAEIQRTLDELDAQEKQIQNLQIGEATPEQVAEVAELYPKENINAIIQGEEQENNGQELSGTPQGQAIQEDLGQIRQEEGRRPGGSDRLIESGQIPQQVKTVRRDSLSLDPVRFQFKRDVDKKTGTGDELKGVKWNPDLGGVILTWFDPKDGGDYVVNGHHRFENATENGIEFIDVRPIQAANAHEARIKGALANIAEGRGTPFDAARILRDASVSQESLRAMGVSAKGKLFKDGLSLSRLHEGLLNQTEKGEIPLTQALVIGESLPNHSDQWEIIKKIDAAKRPVSSETLREWIRFTHDAPRVQRTEESLFGPEEFDESAALEKAELSSFVKGKLSKDRKLFGFISKGDRASELTRGGNVIDVDQSKNIADTAAKAEETYTRLSGMAGPISDALNNGAVELKKGGNANEIRSKTYDAVTKAIETELRGVPARNAAVQVPSPVRGAGSADRTQAGDLFSKRTDPEIKESSVPVASPEPALPVPEPSDADIVNSLDKKQLAKLAFEINVPGMKGKPKTAESILANVPPDDISEGLRLLRLKTGKKQGGTDLIDPVAVNAFIDRTAESAKWLGTKLEGAYRSAIDFASRGLDYFTWAKDAVMKFGSDLMNSAREIWRSAVATLKAFVQVPGGQVAQRRGAIGTPGLAEQETKKSHLDPDLENKIVGKTPAQMMAVLVTNAPSPGLQIIAARTMGVANKLVSLGLDLSATVVNEGDQVPSILNVSNAVTWRGTDETTKRPFARIYLRSKALGRPGTDYYTVLHEFLHAVLDGAIVLGNLKKSEGTAIGEAVSELYKVHNSIIRHINTKFDAAKTGKTTLSAFEQRIQNGINAFKNPRETIAWALTEPEAQAYLKTIPSTKDASLWTRFVNAVSHLLGLETEHATKLEEVLSVAEKLFDAPVEERLKVAEGTAYSFSRAEQIANQRPFTPEQIETARKEFGGLKQAEQQKGLDIGVSEDSSRTAYVTFWGRVENLLQRFGDTKMISDVFNAMNFGEVLFQRQGFTDKQIELLNKRVEIDARKAKLKPGTQAWDNYIAEHSKKPNSQQTWAERRVLATWTGRDIGSIVKRKPGQPLNSVDTEKVKMAYETTATLLDKVYEVIHNTPNDADALAAREFLMKAFGTISAVYNGNNADYARGLNAAKDFLRPERNTAKMMTELLKHSELTSTQVDMIRELDKTNPDFMKNVDRIIKTDWFDKLFEYYLGNILYGIRTNTRNLVSNTAHLLSHPVEVTFAYGLDVLRGEKHGRSLADGWALVEGWGKAWNDANRVAIQAFIEGDASGIKYDNKAVQRQWTTGEGIGGIKGEHMRRAIEGKFGYFIRMPSNLLRACDAFFRTLASFGHLNMQAYRSAKLAGHSLGSTAWKNFVTDFTTNPSDEAMAAAAKEGSYRVFNSKITNQVVNSLIHAKGAKTFMGRMLSLLMPFVKTPYNILVQGLERSPVGFYWTQQGKSAGTITQAQMADELAKPVLGCMVLGTGAFLVLNGLLTGGGPKDEGERQRKKDSGWIPYSIRIGDKMISLDSIEPLLGTTMAMMADATEAWMRPQGNKSMEEIIRLGTMATLEGILKNIHNKTFLRGLMSANDAMTDPARYGGSFIENFASGMAPASGLGRSFKDMADPVKYRVDSPIDSFFNVYPVLSASKLFPKLDSLGRIQMSQPSGTGIVARIWRGASPLQYSEVSQDPADLVLDAFGVDKGMPQKKATYLGKTYDLPPNLHNAYIRDQGLRVLPYLRNIARNLLPRRAAMNEKQVEFVKKSIETQMSKFRQTVLKQLVVKWKKEGLIK